MEEPAAKIQQKRTTRFTFKSNHGWLGDETRVRTQHDPLLTPHVCACSKSSFNSGMLNTLSYIIATFDLFKRPVHYIYCERIHTIKILKGTICVLNQSRAPIQNSETVNPSKWIGVYEYKHSTSSFLHDRRCL